jgi:uncharacterized protein YbjT (DUF2867 family)
MTDRKLILVTGATGAQGGGVARHLLHGGRFAVRALTREPGSEKAERLRLAGAEVVKGDLGDAQSLRAATRGVYGVFGVTNFWEHFGGEREQGRNLVDAVAEAGVGHFVFSTLPPALKISGGELEVPHFDIKAELEEYARLRVPGATSVHVAFYYENFLGFFLPRKGEDGVYSFGFPQGDTPLAAVSVEDVGGVVAALFERPDEFKGRTVGVVGDDLPPGDYAAAMTRLLGRTVKYEHVPREIFAGFGFLGAEDLANMFDFNRRFIPGRRADLKGSRSLYPGVKTFEAWLGENKRRFAEIFGE